MTRLCWQFLDILSRTLESDERDAVRGDLAESGATGGQALGDVLGLVVRRQAAFWKDWHPWLALVCLVGLAGVLLSELAFQFDGEILTQVRTYWRHGVHYGTGLSVGEDAVCLLCLFLAVFAWSWTSGFVLGSLSGRATWLTGTLFCLVVHSSYVLRLPGVQLSRIFLNLILPMSIPMLPFLIGAIWGMNSGVRMRVLDLRHALLLAAVIAILTLLVTWTGGWYETVREVWSEGAWQGIPWPRRLLPLATVSWPVAYMLATASWRRRHERTVAN
jgi:hypothetical protein